MSLTIYYSDKIEELAADLKGKLLAERQAPGADPFAFSQVVVPNKNIATWLQIESFSSTRELCAGIEFPFMEKRLIDLLRRNSEAKKFSPIPDHAYANAILATLLAKEHSEFDAFAPFRLYIADGKVDTAKPLDISTQKSARKAWQLADRLADLMDQYEVRRPDIVANWPAAKNSDGRGTPTPGSAEAGEAALARALWGPNGAFPDGGERRSLRQLYDCVKQSAPAGNPETIYFFGQSTLSLLQARILVWLAKKHDVVFYHNNVCLEYWGDIETKEERRRRLGHAHDAEEDIAIENPLLSQWGPAGRETLRLLVDLEEENDGKIDFTWKCIAPSCRPEPKKLLGRIQNSIRHRTGEVGKAPQDASLQVIGTPGIRREVEMVYNAILGAVWKPEDSGDRPWDECSLSDIAVLVPDMATYRPVIEAVFDARGEIRYGLVDTTASSDSAYLAGFLALADLARKGLTRETLFAVLDNPCVQEALKFSSDDVRKWRNLTARIGAFDGFTSRGDESFFNWDWALSRLRLAMVADEVTRERGTGDGENIPLVPVNDMSALRLSGIVELLYRRMEEVFRDAGSGAPRRLPCAPQQGEEKDTGKPNWSRVLSRLAKDFLAVPADDELEGPVRRQVLLTLGGLAGIPGEQEFELAVAAVEHFVGGISCRKGSYLTDGVTIAGLQPMRPVPFKQVFVLGLGEGGFPGRTGAVDTLDVRGTGWKLGDVSIPKTNRYLFLETLMAVRDRLVLSYPNRDIEKDAELFPSGIVFAGTVVMEGKFAEFPDYPLLERGERGAKQDPVCDVAWSKDDPFAGLLPTYSTWARTVAAALRGAMPENASTRPAGGGDASRKARPEVSAKELAAFLASPLHAVLRFRVGIAEKGSRDQELDIDSPLGVPDGPVKWGLQMDWLQGNGEVDGPFRELQLAGQTPVGFLGTFARETFEEKNEATKNTLLDFAKEFGLGTEACGTLRQGFPETLGDSQTRQEVLFTSATPNWSEAGTEVSALVAGYLGDKPPRLPPENTLGPFVSFLMFVKKKEVPWSLRVGVIDIEHGKTASWRWTVAPADADRYLERLTLRYLGHLDSPDGEGKYVDFPYRKLARGLEDESEPIDWSAVLEKVKAEEFSPKRGNGKKGLPAAKGYDSDLVIEQTVKTYRRDPTEDELRELHADIYQLPLSGQKENGDEAQADATQEGAQ